VALAVLLFAAGCKRSKPLKISRVWLGPETGCAETEPHPSVGTFACWGRNDHGQLGDGTTTSRPFANRVTFPFGKVTELAFGETHACAVFDARLIACWGDGSHGELGPGATRKSLVAERLGEKASPGQTIAVGRAHTCAKVGESELSCFGADDAGQLGHPSGPYPAPGKDWSRGAPIVSFALGAAHTCVAYGASKEKAAAVDCRGRDPAAPGDPMAYPLLGSEPVRELAAGDDHTCALLANGTVRCWGKNDAGQLGDGTTADSRRPVSVDALAGVIQVAAGARHTCALLRNGTVACWGDNAHHQLAIGTTENSATPRLVVGIVGAKELSLAGDGACVRLDGGYARCWGRNDRGQLGDGTTEEHTVPMPMSFR
jgi:alpha-tubulin suppressor-like RCC1 family protein